MGKQFIEVTEKLGANKRLINVDKIISIIEQSDGTAFVEFYASRNTRSYGISCAEGYEKVKCMLVDIFEGAQ